MPQLPSCAPIPCRVLETFIDREGPVLSIPEGIHTIPCTHGLHRFPGKFIPNLPRYFLRTILKERASEIICDPFCGSGTTLVEAALEGRRFIGFDIDPLSVAIAKAKTRPLDESDISTLDAYWQKFDYKDSKPDLVPVLPNLQHWFSPPAISELSAIKSGCLVLPKNLRQFCLIVLSSIIRRVSNADDQTQKTYVSHTLIKKPPLPSLLFPVFLQRAISGMRQYAALLEKPVEGEILRADARNLPMARPGDVITSPPYIDSIDYVYNQMLEYFWLLPELGIDGYSGYRALRKLPMGFGRTSTGNDLREQLLGTTRANFEEACELIEKISPKEARTVRGFFGDFLAHCNLMATRQETGAYYICVVANSVIRRVTVPTVDILRDLFCSAGYTLCDRLTYQIRRHYMKFPRRGNSGKIKLDHVLIFRR